jgi:hypothetical protein
MALELFLPPFLQAQSFLNLHSAFDDVNFGVNEEMLYLGANFGLDPHDLLKIIHDKTTGLNQKKIIKLLQNGVTSIDYISNLHRLYDLGFTIAELRILMQASISAANVLTYDVIQLFNAIGFTSDFAINGFTNDNIQPTQVSPFIEIGFSVDQHAYIVGYVKNEISPSVAASFNFIGLMHYLPILDFIKAEISPDEVSSFYNIGIVYHKTIIRFIKAGISSNEVASFHDIGLKNVSLIFKYKNAGLTADKVSSFFQIENKFSLCPHEIIKYTETLVFP